MEVELAAAALAREPEVAGAEHAWGPEVAGRSVRGWSRGGGARGEVTRTELEASASLALDERPIPAFFPSLGRGRSVAC